MYYIWDEPIFIYQLQIQTLGYYEIPSIKGSEGLINDAVTYINNVFKFLNK